MGMGQLVRLVPAQLLLMLILNFRFRAAFGCTWRDCLHCLQPGPSQGVCTWGPPGSRPPLLMPPLLDFPTALRAEPRVLCRGINNVAVTLSPGEHNHSYVL